jgi:hypothetical protein
MNEPQGFDERKILFDEIKKFNRGQQEELYRILRREGEELSENRNGMFFDLNALKPTTIQEIQKWVGYCKKNDTDLEQREQEMKKLLEEIKDEEQ